MELIKNFDDKIAIALSKVKQLKEEKNALERKVSELQSKLIEKDEELRALASEKNSIKGQIEDLLNELESIEIS